MSAPHWTDGLPGVWPLLAILGLCLGSFANVVIHRLPLGLSLVRPRSRCPRCESRIAPYDNVPVASYLLLRGRCRRCRAPIPLRYPAVEIAGAVAVLVAAASAPGPAEAAIRAAFLLALLVITWIDLDHRIIPDEISLPGVAAGLLLCPWMGVSRLDGAIGVAAGAGALLAVAAAYRAIRGAAGMGMGDVKLAGMLGAFLGWKGVLMAIFLGSLLGSLFAIALLFARRADGRTALPYGTFLAPAAAVVLLAGSRALTWYLGLFAPFTPGSR